MPFLSPGIFAYASLLFLHRKLRLYTLLISLYFSKVCSNKKTDLKLTSHASFLKNDSYYIDYILKELEDIDEDDEEKILNNMQIFNI